MRRFLILALSASALVPAAAAQTFTSPKGLGSTEGNALFFASTNRFYQSVDMTNTGSVVILKSFAMRRDKGSASRVGASTVDATLTVGETDMATVCGDPSRNFTKGKKVVFPKKNISWPDWGAASPTPAPFDAKIPFSSNTYLYLGLNALVWELVLENGTNTGNLFDRDYTGYTQGTSTSLSAGCGSFAMTSAMQSNGTAFRNNSMRLSTGVTGAPPSSPVALSLALTDANATVPGFCAKLHALPIAILPMGVSDTAGLIYNCYFNFPYNAALNGFTLYSQAFSAAGRTLTLSNGRSAVMPTASTTTGHEACYLWQSLTTPGTNFVFTGGSILAQFEG